MIPADFVTQWRASAPWIENSQVEQDLVISRALVELFSDEEIARRLSFRGGTALFKLYLTPPPRYSEDIDLVQTTAEPIGETINRIRRSLDPWLDQPKRSFNQGRVTLIYRFQSEDGYPLRLKIEINSREHFSVLGLKTKSFEVRSRWFSGTASILTYQLDELLGTKLRALYQRKKGRDLFDIWWASRQAPIDLDCVIQCFLQYLEHGGHRVSRAEFEANLQNKLSDPSFTADLSPLLAPGVDWSVDEAATFLMRAITPRIPGEPWKGLTY